MQRHRPTRRLWCVSIAAITGLTAALAGCGSSDEDDAAPGDAEETEASSPDREPSTATAPVTSSPPTTSAAQTFSIATTPGWQGLLEPILAGLNRIGDGAPTFDLDAAWMDANGAEDVEQAGDPLDEGQVDDVAVGRQRICGIHDQQLVEVPQLGQQRADRRVEDAGTLHDATLGRARRRSSDRSGAVRRE